MAPRAARARVEPRRARARERSMARAMTSASTLTSSAGASRARARDGRASRRRTETRGRGRVDAAREARARAVSREGEDERARASSAVGTSTSERTAEGGVSMSVVPTNGSGSFAGSRVVDFVAAWDAISPRLKERDNEEADKEMLLSALTLAIPRLQQVPRSGRAGSKLAHERAVDVTLTLAELGMDAECLSAGLLREAVVHGTVTLDEIEETLGERVMRLAHDVGRVHDLPKRVHSYDENAAERLRSFYLSFHDVRAIIVELACRLDVLRNADELKPIERTTVALETMQIYAPMAHALNTGSLCAELEDLAFKILFPVSYASLEKWLTVKSPVDSEILDKTTKLLSEAMNSDATMSALIGRGGVKVLARRKSRYSTMKKIIRDGRGREEVHDLLGIRIVLTPQPGSGAELPVIGAVDSGSSTFEQMEVRALKAANAACYRAQQLVHAIFPPMKGRTKDYISKPKQNGYSSLHSTLKVAFDESGTPASPSEALKRGANVELQIRTAAMHLAAEAGKASHTSYKGGLKEDAGMAGYLADLASAANDAAKEKFGAFTHDDLRRRDESHDRLFEAFDLNGDGSVTLTELRTVLTNIWGGEEKAESLREAQALMALLDVDQDGTISPDEFAKFRASITAINALPMADAATCAAIEAVAVEETEVEEALDVNAQVAEDAVIDVDAMAVSTGEVVSEGAELIATVRDAVTSSYEYTGKVDLAGRKAAKAMRDQESGQVEWQLVWDLMRTGRSETARQLFYQRTTRFPGQIAVWEQWARFELLQGDPERARSLYRAALLHCEDRPLVRAEILRKWGMMESVTLDPLHKTSHSDLFSRTIAILSEAQSAGRISAGESREAQAKTYQVWAQGLARNGNFDEAKRLLTKARDLDEGNPAVIHAQGQLEEMLGNVPAAIAMYSFGASKQPDDAFLLQSWARLEAKTGNLDNARTLYERGIAANPENYRLPQAWAVSETEHPDGDATVAREQFQRASSLAPWSVQTWAAWARFEFFAQDNPKAVETAYALYERGLDAEPSNVVCLIGLAKCENRLGRFDAARKILMRAEAMQPDSASVHFERAKVEESAGAPAKADYHYLLARRLRKSSKRSDGRSTRARGKRSTWDPIDAFEREALASTAFVVVDAAASPADDDASLPRARARRTRARPPRPSRALDRDDASTE